MGCTRGEQRAGTVLMSALPHTGRRRCNSCDDDPEPRLPSSHRWVVEPAEHTSTRRPRVLMSPGPRAVSTRHGKATTKTTQARDEHHAADPPGEETAGRPVRVLPASMTVRCPGQESSSRSPRATAPRLTRQRAPLAGPAHAARPARSGGDGLTDQHQATAQPPAEPAATPGHPGALSPRTRPAGLRHTHPHRVTLATTTSNAPSDGSSRHGSSSGNGQQTADGGRRQHRGASHSPCLSESGVQRERCCRAA